MSDHTEELEFDEEPTESLGRVIATSMLASAATFVGIYASITGINVARRTIAKVKAQRELRHTTD